MQTVEQRLQTVRQALAEACRRCGRDPDDITLLAATKARSVPEILSLVQAGVQHLGENYVQEWQPKREAIDKAEPGRVLWHIIGHLQRNKVKYVVPGIALIHSLDSPALAGEIERRAAAAQVLQPVLLEVNVAGERSKPGISPEQAPLLAAEVMALPHLELQGLMTMPPYSANPEASRLHFRALRELAQALVAGGLPGASMRHLSMGMSGDYAVAVEEGATIVRLGTVLFGPRPQ